MLLRKFNEWSRPDFKFRLFKQTDEVHQVILPGKMIRMCRLISLEEARVEFESQGHRDELHLEGLKMEENNRELSPKEVLHQLLK